MAHEIIQFTIKVTMSVHLIWIMVNLVTGLPNQRCGVQVFEDKIIGGENTTIDDYPWAALLRYRHEKKQIESWGCGGAYIGGRTIVTAAHCVGAQTLNDLGDLLFVRLGEFDTENNPDCIDFSGQMDCADTPIDFKIASIAVHSERTEKSKEYDIALIILQKRPPYTDFIRPICLPDVIEDISDNLDGREDLFYVVGWGWTVGFVSSPSNIKQHARIELVHHEICQQQYEEIQLNTNSQICAGGKGGVNPCRGDSGGALMKLVRGVYWQLIGIVSFGPAVCAVGGINSKAAVFTKVQYYIPWIVQNAL